jgi:septal ring factor EnvC (AmiA/AmiB activator)
MATIQAKYEEVPPEPSKRRISVGELAVIVAGILIAVGLSVAALLRSNTMNASQNVSTRALDQNYSQLSGEIGKLKSQITSLTNQLASVNNRLAQTDAKVSADPSNVITCQDLRRMDITSTTGASIVTGGSIALDVSSVPLPVHCRSS